MLSRGYVSALPQFSGIISVAAMIIYLLAFICVFHWCKGTFNPSVTVDVCTVDHVTITVSNAVDGGIIYIRGRGASCTQPTSGITTVHEFDCLSCSIVWSETFVVVIQKTNQYQTAGDLSVPVICDLDLSDFNAMTQSARPDDGSDDTGLNLTVRPTALMSIYNDGVNVNGDHVYLGDSLVMSVELDPEFQADFDILVIQCSASGLSLIEETCSVDTGLFPNFEELSHGYHVNRFEAFRTTDLTGMAVAMVFSCSLRLCLGTCDPITCQENCADNSSTREVPCSGKSLHRKRKKRSNRRLPHMDTGYGSISVGTTVMIMTDDMDISVPDADDDINICLNKILLIAVFTSAVVWFASNIITMSIFYRKLKVKERLREWKRRKSR